MVKLMGHLAMGLLFSSPVWFVWNGRINLAFIGFVLTTSMLPDVDLVLQAIIPEVKHHGVTHTFVFVALVAAVAGVVVARGMMPVLERWWLAAEDRRIPRWRVYFFVTGGLLVGGVSHVFADMLSSPDIAAPVTPLWPFVTHPISFDVIYYSSIWWNLGLLLVALAVHVSLAVLNVSPVVARRLDER